ncbi:hypothetical protein B0H13DRAFT_1656999 [Mycena leptocephala]|nr:hypothetical protein B0H13DRAFT_1656999 [Mycena leptocephala]
MSSHPTRQEERKKERNRTAQRAFRERKAQRIKDLQARISMLEAQNANAINENKSLRSLVDLLTTENTRLKQSRLPSSDDTPPPGLINGVRPSCTASSLFLFTPDSESPHGLELALTESMDFPSTPMYIFASFDPSDPSALTSPPPESNFPFGCLFPLSKSNSSDDDFDCNGFPAI